MFGPIFYIGKISKESKNLAKWTMDWLEDRKFYAGPAVYACSNVNLAIKTLSKPLAKGQPPSLIIIDYNIDNDNIEDFSNKLRSCIPECWIIDLVDKHSIIPNNTTAFALLKPIKKAHWEELLAHIFINATSPQWSKVTEN